MPPPTYLDTRNAANYAAVAEVTVARAVRAGKLRACRAVTKEGQKKALLRFLQADLDAWLGGTPTTAPSA